MTLPLTDEDPIKRIKRRSKMERARRELNALLENQKTIDLADAARRIRKMTGLTQKAFAAHFDIGLEQVKNLESGRGNPTIETIMKILKPAGLKLRVGR